MVKAKLSENTLDAVKSSDKEKIRDRVNDWVELKISDPEKKLLISKVDENVKIALSVNSCDLVNGFDAEKVHVGSLMKGEDLVKTELREKALLAVKGNVGKALGTTLKLKFGLVV